MNYELAGAIAECVHDRDADSAERLARYSYREWKSCEYWLDTCGLALYLADTLNQLNAADVTPERINRRLQQNLADSKQRFEVLFREFCRLNEAFATSGREYIVQKGFSLYPDFCADPVLRLQLDFDFRIGTADYPEFHRVLEGLGYKHLDATFREARYDTHPGEHNRRADLFKPTNRFRVELHFDNSAAHPRLPEFLPDHTVKTAILKSWKGVRFPVLRATEQVVECVDHIHQHFNSGWVRPSWLLELLRVADSRRGDHRLWLSLRQRASADAELARSLALLRHSRQPLSRCRFRGSYHWSRTLCLSQ